jgi:hypothetical protein
MFASVVLLEIWFSMDNVGSLDPDCGRSNNASQ